MSQVHVALRRRVAHGQSLAAAVREDAPLSATQALDTLAKAAADIHGIGWLQALVTSPRVTDIVVHQRQVWVDRGEGMERTDFQFQDDRDVRAFAVRLAALAGQRLDDAVPILDGVLDGGIRIHAVLPPLSQDGTSISLRIHHQESLSFGQLVASGCFGTRGAESLQALVHGRANVVVAGSTGSGKTTLLSALLGLVDQRERIVCIEEVRELEPDHPHVVHLQARGANVQNAGAVGLDSLVRAALRMRPDRLVLGEARGAEIRDVLMALNTGHAGSWFTLHANRAKDVPARLMALGALGGWDSHAVTTQVAAAIDAVVMMKRTTAGRHLSQMAQVTAHQGELVVVPVLDAAGSERGEARAEILGEGWMEFARTWGL